MNQDAQNKKLSQIIAKSWSDDGFKKKLLSNPVATLKAESVPVADGVTVKVLENTANVVHIVIPTRPTELSDEDLDQVAGGAACTCDHPGRTYSGSIITVVKPKV